MITVKLLLIMLRCLLCTIVIEGFLGFAFGVRKKRSQLIVLLANVITNPVLVSVSLLLQLMLVRNQYYLVLYAMEIAVVIIEGTIYKFVLKPKMNPFLLSLLLNAGSYFIGEILNRFIF